MNVMCLAYEKVFIDRIDKNKEDFTQNSALNHYFCIDSMHF